MCSCKMRVCNLIIMYVYSGTLLQLRLDLVDIDSDFTIACCISSCGKFSNVLSSAPRHLHYSASLLASKHEIMPRVNESAFIV